MNRFPEGDDIEPDNGRSGGSSITIYQKGTRSSPTHAPTPLDAGGLIRLVPWTLVERDIDIGIKLLDPDNGSVIDVMAVYTHEAAYRANTVFPISPVHNAPHGAGILAGMIQVAIDFRQ